MKIGVLGAGQLGRMLALAGYPMGLTFDFYDEKEMAPASVLAPQTVAAFTDEAMLAKWAESVDVITYEFENVPLSAVRFLEGIKPVMPNSTILEIAQDRLFEKNYFKKLGITTPRFAAVNSEADLMAAVKDLRFPCVLKTRRFGYDGKGQFVLKAVEDIETIKEVKESFENMILEEFIPYTRELSLIAVRSKKGEKAFYPLVENHHRDGILRVTLAPALQVSLEEQKRSHEYLNHILDATDYVGVLSVEFFEKKGILIANEMAPRVHNSGHWTIDGAKTSQFENHLRAILGWPLGSTEAKGCSAMINIIGRYPKEEDVLAIPEAHWHHYNKTEMKGRKLGHVTITAEKLEDLSARLTRFKQVLG